MFVFGNDSRKFREKQDLWRNETRIALAATGVAATLHFASRRSSYHSEITAQIAQTVSSPFPGPQPCGTTTVYLLFLHIT